MTRRSTSASLRPRRSVTAASPISTSTPRPDLNLYVQALVGQSVADQPDHGGRFANVTGIDTRITIYRENPFLPAAVRQIMVNEGSAVVPDERGRQPRNPGPQQPC